METFGEAPPEAAWGTATPQYMAGAPSGPDGARPDSADPRPETYIPTRIRAVSPEAKLIAILRSPSKRAFSQYRMEALGGTEVRTFDEAVAQLLEPGELRSARRSPTSTNSYVISGEYGRILSGYYETFPREQLLVVFTDELEHAPRATIRLLLDHIGVDPDFVPSGLGRRYRQGATRRRIDWLDLPGWQTALAFNPVLAALWRRLPPRARSRLLAAYTVAEYRIGLWNRVVGEGSRPAPVSPETWQALDAHYSEDAKLLQRLVERELPW